MLQSMVQTSIQSSIQPSLINQHINDILIASESIVAVSSALFIGSKIKKNLKIESTISRKLIHILTGPLYLESWKYYTDSEFGHIISSIVPIFVMISLYINKNKDIGLLISRNKEELDLNVQETFGISEGPLMYIYVLLILNILNWRNIHSILSVSCLSFGDGFSDLIGRKFGKDKWFLNKDKSYIGSVAFILFSVLGSLYHLNSYDYNINPDILVKLILHCSIISIIEVIDLGNDNINVPFSSFLLSNLLFKDII